MKILVYGASGTGKTLLSQRLSKDLLIDFYSIDDIFWKKKFTEVHNAVFIEDKISSIINTYNWIVEGAYLDDFMKSLFVNADIIIYCKEKNIIKLCYRIIRRKKQKENFASIINLLIWNLCNLMKDNYGKRISIYKFKVISIKNVKKEYDMMVNYIKEGSVYE